MAFLENLNFRSVRSDPDSIGDYSTKQIHQKQISKQTLALLTRQFDQKFFHILNGIVYGHFLLTCFWKKMVKTVTVINYIFLSIEGEVTKLILLNLKAKFCLQNFLL